MYLSRFIAVSTIAVLLPLSALATTIYDCKIKDKSSSGWVPTVLVIAHDAENGTVVVNDPIISQFNDDLPIDGKVLVENAKRVTFGWTLKGVRNQSGQYAPNFNYRATYLKASKTMRVYAKPLNYPNDFKGTGTCILKTG